METGFFDKTIEGTVLCKCCGYRQDLTLHYTDVEDEIDLSHRVNEFFKRKDWTILSVPNEQVVIIICEKCLPIIMDAPLGMMC